MKKTPIIISVHTPCREDWSKMDIVDGGRFCCNCRKKVVDFTKCSDEELFKFFSKKIGPTCGRYDLAQLDRIIQRPIKPNGSVKQLAAALGFSLLFSQVATSCNRAKPPLAVENSALTKAKNVTGKGRARLEIKISVPKVAPLRDIDISVVPDPNIQPGVGISAFLLWGGSIVDSAITDNEGKVTFHWNSPDNYAIVLNHPGFVPIFHRIFLGNDSILKIQFEMAAAIYEGEEERFGRAVMGATWHPKILDIRKKIYPEKYDPRTNYSFDD